VVPQVAVLIRPHESLGLRLSVGRNYYTPSLRDLYQPAVPNLGGEYFLEGNPDLDPETSTSWRAGLEWSPRPWLSLSTVGFWNDIEDHIRSTSAGVITVGFTEREVVVPGSVRPGLPFICRETDNFFDICRALETGETQTSLDFDVAPLFRKANLDSVRTRGFETRIELRPHVRFDCQLGYTWLDTKVVDSNLIGLDELPNEPHHTVDAVTRLTVPWIETDFTFQARWRSRAVVESTGTGLLGFSTFEKSDPSFFLDLRVGRQVLSWLEVHADFRNLTNQRIEDSYVVRGRTWFLGLRMDLGGRS
jgi:outer membrane receptor protein involved in Fe transport